MEGRRFNLQSSNIQAIVFDFDGTIANTMPILERIAVTLLQKNYGISKDLATRGYISTTGLPFVQQIELLFPKHSLNQKVVAAFERKKLENIFEQPLFADTSETLDTLRARDYFIVISSSTIQPTIEEYCKRVGIAELLDLMLGFSPGFEKGKAHFDQVCKHFDINPGSILFIGDSIKDAERALEHHTSFIGRTGMFSREEFVKVVPDCITVSSLIELLDIL